MEVGTARHTGVALTSSLGCILGTRCPQNTKPDYADSSSKFRRSMPFLAIDCTKESATCSSFDVKSCVHTRRRLHAAPCRARPTVVITSPGGLESGAASQIGGTRAIRVVGHVGG